MTEPTTKYFGDPKFRKEYETQIETPVGQICVYCDEPVVEGDTGTVNFIGQVIHYECSLRMVIGSVGHQKGTCSCFGGTEEDPPGTKRQAAIAAAQMFHFKSGHL